MFYQEFINTFVDSSPFFPIKGKIITGRNGLYGEKETSFRTLAHWSRLLKDANIEKRRVLSFIDLFMDEFSKHNLKLGPFKARESDTKDSSNGLIGTAWNVEGILSVIELCQIHEVGEYRDTEKKLIEKIYDIYSHYVYDESKCNWPHIIEPNGEVLGLDRTFNHQLWFASIKYRASKLIKDQRLSEDCLHFIKNLRKNQKINSKGVIYHTIGSFPHYHKTYLKRILSKSYRSEMIKKEYGYHLFNLLAYCYLLDEGVESIRNRIIKNLKVVNTNLFRSSQENNEFGSSYNPVGLEAAVAISKISFNDEDILYWINYHFKGFFDNKEFVFKKSDDDATLNSRLYELTYLNPETKKILKYDLANNKWCFVKPLTESDLF